MKGPNMETEGLKGLAKITYEQAMKYVAVLNQDQRSLVINAIYSMNRKEDEKEKCDFIHTIPNCAIENFKSVSFGLLEALRCSPVKVKQNDPAIPVVYCGTTIVNKRSGMILRNGEFGYLHRHEDNPGYRSRRGRWLARQPHSVGLALTSLGTPSNHVKEHSVDRVEFVGTIFLDKLFTNRDTAGGNLETLVMKNLIPVWGVDLNTEAGVSKVAEIVEENTSGYSVPIVTSSLKGPATTGRFKVGDQVKVVVPRRGFGRGPQSSWNKIWIKGKIVKVNNYSYGVYAEGRRFTIQGTSRNLREV